LAAVAVLLFVAGLVFLYLWLNTRAIVAQRELSQTAFELKQLETALVELEYRVEASFSTEALMQLVRELNEEAMGEGKPLLGPLGEEQLIILPVHVERGRD